jgi:hypothetical protein
MDRWFESEVQQQLQQFKEVRCRVAAARTAVEYGVEDGEFE